MLKIENVEVAGWKAAIRGMRNPMNSWAKSDSGFGCTDIATGITSLCDKCPWNNKGTFACRKCFLHYKLGPNDHALAMKLARAGAVHAKYRRMIQVYADITAPLYWWKEFDTYRTGVEKNSCSTMHKITEKEFTAEDFSCEHLANFGYWSDNKDAFKEDAYDFGGVMTKTLGALNEAREQYFDRKQRWPNDEQMAKEAWWQIIQLLPSSYNQKRTVMMSYEALANIYHHRKNHKLDEWRLDFCKWIKTLPYSELITLEDKKQ